MILDVIMGVIIFIVGIITGIFVEIYMTDGYICKRHECKYRTYETED